MYKIIGADQKEYGPISGDQLRDWITQGRVNAQTMVLPEGAGQWQPASALPEFASLFSAASAGAPPPLAAPSGSVPNYLVQSILVTLCCCLPFGIVAIIYAAQVNGKLAAGDYQGAVTASNNAKKWSWIGFIVGIIVTIIWVIAQFALGLGSRHRF